jgi:hypothetical protein
MNPILRTGDGIHVVPYDGKEIRRGDVIVFIPSGGDSRIVHRVISVDSQGIRTRGDNCSHIDPWALSPQHIIGRVVSVQRRGRRCRIVGGSMGLCLAVVVRAINRVDSSASSMLRPIYHRLGRTGIFRRWVPCWLETRVVSFNRPAGRELQLLIGHRVIGRWLPGRSHWHIRRPFRLIVDEASLPENPSKLSLGRCPYGGSRC